MGKHNSAKQKTFFKIVGPEKDRWFVTAPAVTTAWTAWQMAGKGTSPHSSSSPLWLVGLPGKTSQRWRSAQQTEIADAALHSSPSSLQWASSGRVPPTHLEQTGQSSSSSSPRPHLCFWLEPQGLVWGAACLWGLMELPFLFFFDVYDTRSTSQMIIFKEILAYIDPFYWILHSDWSKK